jgi:hypothetical protein
MAIMSGCFGTTYPHSIIGIFSRRASLQTKLVSREKEAIVALARRRSCDDGADDIDFYSGALDEKA